MFLTEISVRPKRPAGEQAQQKQAGVAQAQQGQQQAGQRNREQMQQNVQKQQTGQEQPQKHANQAQQQVGQEQPQKQQGGQEQQAGQEQKQGGDPLDNWDKLAPDVQAKKLKEFAVGIQQWIKANPDLKQTILTVLRNASENKS